MALSDNGKEATNCKHNGKSEIKRPFTPEDGVINDKEGKRKGSHLDQGNSHEEEVLEGLLGVGIAKHPFEYGWKKQHHAVVDETGSEPTGH